jgi:uncharacterized protein (TIGR02391 family)
MSIITEVFPPLEVALKLEPEELAIPLLECLCRIEESGDRSGSLNRYNFTLDSNLRDYCKSGQYFDIATAITEAWMWLEREGLIAPKPDQNRDWIFVTRRGREFRKMGDPKRFKTAKFLPHEVLDPQLVAKAGPPFLRGEYDSAVFEAFKEVEIRVRMLSGADKADIGVSLMRKAFRPETGILTDKTQLQSEQQAISDLFAGAIGLFKNPSSHRDVNFDDPIEVSDLIMFADKLIRIAERRKPQT